MRLKIRILIKWVLLVQEELDCNRICSICLICEI